MPLGAYRLNGLGRYLAPTGRDAKTITTIAQAQVDTAQSKFGGASMLTDGNSDCLYATGFDLTGDWTMEGWYRINSTVSEVVLFRIHSSADGFLMNYGLLNNRIYTFNAGTTVGPTTLSLNQWYHLAYVNSGTGDLLFVNGVLEATRPNSRTIANSIIRMSGIGFGSYSLNGWSDEIRISKTARYTSAFTPPTTAFTNDADTLILIHCDGTDGSTLFQDDVGVRTKVGVAAVGNAQIDTAQSKFGGASALFDGTGDYLALNSQTAGPQMIPSTGTFTVEMWVYWTNTSTQKTVISQYGFLGDSNPAGRFILRSDSSTTARLFIDGIINVTTGIAVNTWYHFAISRDGSNVLRFFKDGTLVSSATTANAIAGGYTAIGTIGNVVTNFMQGYIDEVRISNIARYTANFTPSTTPFVNDENTTLLLHMDGTDASTFFEDDNGARSKIGVQAIANAQIDTAQSKFGGASGYFDGTGDWLIAQEARIPETGDFTIEFWIRPPNTGERFDIVCTNTTGSGRMYTNTTTANKFEAFIGWTGTGGNLALTSTTTYSANTWYHYAFVRSSNNYYLFMDGNLEASELSGYSRSIAQVLTYIGVRPGAGNDAMRGHLDELRISNTARYTANFTPQTTPFQNDSNTVLLLHMDGTDGSTVFTDDNGVPPDYEY